MLDTTGKQNEKAAQPTYREPHRMRTHPELNPSGKATEGA